MRLLCPCDRGRPRALFPAGLIALVVLAVLAAAAPGAQAAVRAPVTRVQLLRSAGALRQYTTVTPAGGGRGLPMVVFLGGTSATTPEEEERDELLPLVAAGELSLVYPIGLGRHWDVGPSCCTAPGTPAVDDQSYVRAVTKLAVAEVHPAVRRIYLIGYSAGAKLAWQLICARPGPFAALATYGGNPETTCPDHGTPLPVFIGFGAHDVNEPIAGRRSDGRGVHPPAVVNIDTWLTRDGCSAARRHVSRLGGTIGGPVVVTGWTPCARPGLTVQYGVWLDDTHSLPQPPTVSVTNSFGPLAWGFVRKFTRS
jgi:poly(3-hydroxybutyrate) depolymerase